MGSKRKEEESRMAKRKFRKGEKIKKEHNSNGLEKERRKIKKG